MSSVDTFKDVQCCDSHQQLKIKTKINYALWIILIYLGGIAIATFEVV